MLGLLSQVSEGGNGDASVEGRHCMDPKIVPLPSRSPGTPSSAWAVSPSSTFGAALLDGAVALVSESSLSWSSADGPRRRINPYSINSYCISQSLWKICCAPGAAESCSEHICCQTAFLAGQSRALR